MPTIRSGCSATTATTSCVASWVVKVGLADRDRLVAVDEGDRQGAAERGRLGVEDVDLIGLGRQLDGHPEARLALGAARESQLAADRRAVVLEVDGDRDPRPEPGVTAEQDASLHRRPADRRRGAGDRPEGREDERDRGDDPGSATRDRGVAWHERVTGHGHST